MLTAYFFRPSLRDDKPLEDVAQKSRQEETESEEPFLLCRQCLNPITAKSARIAVDGAHQHTFANPHGVVFDIGCFKTAEGCAVIGRPTDEFTWFAGTTWRIAMCRACMTHMGWLYIASGGSRFFGLILDHLVDSGI